MPRKSAAPPTVNKVEQDFHNAIDRLFAGQPTNPGLKKKQAAGKLKINVANVALEAGRSRTLIGTENCDYPAVRIEGFSGAKGSGSQADEFDDRHHTPPPRSYRT